MLNETQINPESLELELTESLFMEKTDIIIDKLMSLKKWGISLTLDDFGTGYSSLSYLKKLPIDKIKIDMSFIKGIPHNSDDVSITLTIISMAKNLNLKVLAEGVETKEQQAFLQQHDCDDIQGFLFSKPLDPDVCFEFLKNL